MSTESTLQKLGLGEYESRALDKLITHHDITAEEIAKYTEIPYTKVYHVLTSLEKQGLVKSTIERPKKYRPIEPEEIIGLILEKKKLDLKDIEKDDSIHVYCFSGGRASMAKNILESMGYVKVINLGGLQ